MTEPHKYRPFTTRDGSKACADCYGSPDSSEHLCAEISDRIVEAVEAEVGVSAMAWDTVDPRRVIIAVLKVARAKVRGEQACRCAEHLIAIYALDGETAVRVQDGLQAAIAKATGGSDE